MSAGGVMSPKPKKRYPYVCATCGAKHTEKTKRGHAKMFGHTKIEGRGGNMRYWVILDTAGTAVGVKLNLVALADVALPWMGDTP